MKTVSVFTEKPSNFNPRVEAAACYVEAGGKFLLLKRAMWTSQGGTWGVPAGKREAGETPHEAVIREVYEETSIALNKGLKDFGALYVRYPDLDFVYHMFYQVFSDIPQVILSDEHTEFRFLTSEEFLAMPLILGGAEAFHHFRTVAARS